MALRGPWSQHLRDQIGTALRTCLAGPCDWIIVDLHHVDDPSGASVPFWLAAWRQARLEPPPTQLTFALAATTTLGWRLRHLQGPQPRVFTTGQEAHRAIAERIRGVRYSHLLDLHGNLRSHALRRLAPGPWRSYHKHTLERALLITTKRDRYGAYLAVAERYFEAAKELEVEPDGGPPDFYISEEADCGAAERLVALELGRAVLQAKRDSGDVDQEGAADVQARTDWESRVVGRLRTGELAFPPLTS